MVKAEPIAACPGVRPRVNWARPANHAHKGWLYVADAVCRPTSGKGRRRYRGWAMSAAPSSGRRWLGSLTVHVQSAPWESALEEAR